MVELFGMMTEMGPWGHGSGFWGAWMLVPALLWMAFFGLVAWGALRVFSIRQGSGRAADAGAGHDPTPRNVPITPNPGMQHSSDATSDEETSSR